MCGFVPVLLTIAVVVPQTHGQARASHGPIPVAAIPAILQASEQYPVIALGEDHRHQQLHDFIVSLVSSPGFADRVNDVVVEFGAGRYQGVIDRYLAGNEVSPAELCRVWRDTVNILVWDAPVYRRFFEIVRRVNLGLPPDKRIRVHLGDPEFDWDQIQTNEQWERVAALRDRHAADVVERVLARRRRALLLYGGGHLMRERAYQRFGGTPHVPNLTELVEARHPQAVFAIWTHTGNWGDISVVDSRLRGWKTPSLALLQGNWLGATAVGPKESPRMEELADALLYLGPVGVQTLSKPPDELYRAPAYLRELLRRDQIEGGHNRAELERLVRVTGWVP